MIIGDLDHKKIEGKELLYVQYYIHILYNIFYIHNIYIYL